MSKKNISNQLHVVLGATGALGSNLVMELLLQGKKTVAVARNKKEAKNIFQSQTVEIRQADAKNLGELREALSGSNYVYHCIGLPYNKWLDEFPQINHNILKAIKEHQSVLIYSDNLYMYGKMQSKTIDENHPISKESKKGYLRHQLAQEILEAHKKGSINAVIARAGDFYGPHVDNGFTHPLFFKPSKGKSASWLVDENQPHSLIYVKDMAKAMIKLAENSDTYGEIWHIPGDKALTGKEFIFLIEDRLGADHKRIKVLSPFGIKILGIFISVLREMKELLFEWRYPFIIDGSKFQERFPKYTPTPHERAIDETLKWVQQQIK